MFTRILILVIELVTTGMLCSAKLNTAVVLLTGRYFSLAFNHLSIICLYSLEQVSSKYVIYCIFIGFFIVFLRLLTVEIYDD